VRARTRDRGLRYERRPFAFDNPIVPEPVFRLKISGVVQGVGYRWSMVEEARRLGVRGGVRNCRDGSVEAIVAGPAEALEQIIAWARTGPPSARVSAVDVLAAEGSFESFEAWATD
jgi:acylphosphatase